MPVTSWAGTNDVGVFTIVAVTDARARVFTWQGALTAHKTAAFGHLQEVINGFDLQAC